MDWILEHIVVPVLFFTVIVLVVLLAVSLVGPTHTCRHIVSNAEDWRCAP